MNEKIPVVVFAYSRADHARRMLHLLADEGVELAIVFADGSPGPAMDSAVRDVRAVFADWRHSHLKLEVNERPTNVGLGRNILDGVSQVAVKHPAFIVMEDDLTGVPGFYGWMCAALRRYADDERVMSVSGWTHPRVAPSGLADAQAYCDARAEGWSWGSYRRAWAGMMEQVALEKMSLAKQRGIKPHAYGWDLPAMARDESTRNIWAVRWIFHHLMRGGLCVRPARSLIEHLGDDHRATNAGGESIWRNPGLPQEAPKAPIWPEPVEHQECRARWRRAFPARPWRILFRLHALLGRTRAANRTNFSATI